MSPARIVQASCSAALQWADGRRYRDLAVYRPLIGHHASLTVIVASVYQGQRA